MIGKQRFSVCDYSIVMDQQKVIKEVTTNAPDKYDKHKVITVLL